MNTRTRRGFGLIELMVALAISSLLLIGITQLFISSKDNYRVIEGLSRLQENARFAIDSLSRDLRHSGLYGCRSGVAMWGLGQTPRFENPVIPATFQTDFSNGNALQGYNSTDQIALTWLPTDPVGDGAVAATNLVAGSDMIVIRGSLQAGERVQTVDVPTNTITAVGDITSPSAGIFALGDLRFEAGDPMMIAGCDGATLFTVGAVTTTPANTITSGEALGQPFDNTAELYSAATIVYYIRDNPNGLRSLYRRVNTDLAQELVSGVQSMQILYGEDTGTLDNVADRYLDAEAAPNMNNVVSIRIGLLMVTPDSVRREADGPSDYDVLGELGVPARDERSLHQLVVSTITLRNRVL